MVLMLANQTGWSHPFLMPVSPARVLLSPSRGAKRDLHLFSGRIFDVTCPRIAILGTDGANRLCTSSVGNVSWSIGRPSHWPPDPRVLRMALPRSCITGARAVSTSGRNPLDPAFRGAERKQFRVAISIYFVSPPKPIGPWEGSFFQTSSGAVWAGSFVTPHRLACRYLDAAGGPKSGTPNPETTSDSSTTAARKYLDAVACA